MRLTALLILLALACAVPALGFYEDKSLPGDLDGDAATETVRTVRVQEDPAAAPDDEVDRVQVNVSDSCAADTKVAGPQDSMAQLRLVPADTLPGSEVLVDLRSGASGRAGEFRLVAWRLDGAGCGAPRDLFRYFSDRPTRRPKGTVGAASFGAKLKEIVKRFPGREIVLIE